MTRGSSSSTACCWRLVLLVAVCWVVITPSQGDLSIAAFNVRIFGTSKADKADVMKTLVKVVRRYDIILIQEIRDKSGTAIQQLMDEVNKEAPTYAMTISERLGRSSSKEQYAFLYRDDSGISVTATYQDPDTADLFQRPPYAVHFKSTHTLTTDFVLMAIHTSPGSAVSEIDALDSVHSDVVSRWHIENVLIMGDFNADCSYVTKSKSSKLKLRSAKYYWWIGDDVDTTVAATDCAYDRFVMSGDGFISSVTAGSADVFRFDTAYGLTQEQTADVSDHYPVQLQLKTISETTSSSSSHNHHVH
ncbi:Deoxyribonuclease-1 [Lamellibrachia satsuma]|nr:Deoxyribonuclease-1 [Lamellibrachia satsuma]